MKSTIKPLLLVVLLAGAGFAALAQGPMGGDCGGPMGGGHAWQEHMGGPGMGPMGAMGSSRMQAWIGRRQAELKQKLGLSAAQESAWSTYVAALQPTPGAAGARPERAEFERLAKLPTPERLDQMKALRSRHLEQMNAAQDRRAEATKVFYAALTPQQQQVFDANAMPMPRPHRSVRPERPKP